MHIISLSSDAAKRKSTGRDLVLFLALASPVLFSGCIFGDSAFGDSDVLGVSPFHVELTWDQPADLDLRIWLSPTSQCSQNGCVSSQGFLTNDDISGTGPETYTAPQNNGMQTYRVGVNLHTFNPPAIPGPRQATITVTAHTGEVYTYGPYELTVAIEDGGYPVIGDTESWWRPLDIRVGDTQNELVTVDTLMRILYRTHPDSGASSIQGRSAT